MKILYRFPECHIGKLIKIYRAAVLIKTRYMITEPSSAFLVSGVLSFMAEGVWKLDNNKIEIIKHTNEDLFTDEDILVAVLKATPF